MSLYTIVFSDNTKFLGGQTYFETKWQEIPSKSIRSIFYTLPSGDILCLSNFKRIICFIEGCKNLTGGKTNNVQLAFSHLIIERGESYLHYKVDLKKGNMDLEVLDKKDKWINSINPIGWKKGFEER